MFRAARTVLPLFIPSWEGEDRTAWQHTASRLRFSSLLSAGLSLLARGKRKRKEKGDLPALSRVAQTMPGFLLIEGPKPTSPSPCQQALPSAPAAPASPRAAANPHPRVRNPWGSGDTQSGEHPPTPQPQQLSTTGAALASWDGAHGESPEWGTALTSTPPGPETLRTPGSPQAPP